MTVNFTMFAGDTKTVRIIVLDPDGNSVDITGASAKWRVKRSFSKAPDIEKTTSAGIVITNGAGGEMTVSLDPEDTEDLQGNFLHEAEVTFTDDTISTVIQGTLTIRPVAIEAT